MAELRRYLRLTKEYRVEYGPFPASGRDDEFRTGVIRNIGGGGLLLGSEEDFPVGSHLILKTYINGWREEGDDLIEAEDPAQAARITAIAEVLRSEYQSGPGIFHVAVRFLGRILT